MRNYSSSTESFPTFMRSRCIWPVASTQPGFAPPSPTVPSPSSPHLHCSSTSASVFLSFSSPPLHIHPHHSFPHTTYSSFVLMTYPYHFNLRSCTFLDIAPTFVVPLIHRSLFCPSLHLNILISATSDFFSCAFFAAHVSAPYIIAGLTTVLYIFPLTIKLMFLSHRTPDILFKFLHQDCTLGLS